MTLTLDERIARKLERLGELSERRKKIATELEEIEAEIAIEIGEVSGKPVAKITKKGVRPLTALDRQAETPGRVKNQKEKVCKICNTPGHIPKTCPKRPFEAPAPVPSGRAPEKVMQASTYAPVEKKALTRDEFDTVKAAQAAAGESFSAARYGMSNRVPPLEAANAARSENYEEYLDKR